jgi:hypothetical protein
VLERHIPQKQVRVHCPHVACAAALSAAESRTAWSLASARKGDTRCTCWSDTSHRSMLVHTAIAACWDGL